ncbi:hypothetical protein PR048_002544 [Dryococelus australis]|uniref:Uncharacterized protein n=1 Tax=Dryococelus australis TaxID=614101 RepID=A0ABQ9IKH0_9NEOP|nr:hypothetical protein PR048_002544 [Dryococelus australis]
MRKGTKSSLQACLEKVTSCSNVPLEPTFAIHGRHLLHRIVSPIPATCRDVCDKHIAYLNSHYPSACVVFDGYSSTPFTKDEEYLRWTYIALSNMFEVQEQIQVCSPQNKFLGNPVNQTRVDIVIVGDYTDLLVLMVVLAPSGGHIKMIVPGSKDQVAKVYSSKDLQNGLGEMKDSFFFLHAVTGCDTTSALYRKGKNSDLQGGGVAIFNDTSASAQQVSGADVAFIVAMYGGKPHDSIDSLRHHLCIKTVARQSLQVNFDITTLPPTSSAARQHCLRVYHLFQ